MNFINAKTYRSVSTGKNTIESTSYSPDYKWFKKVIQLWQHGKIDRRRFIEMWSELQEPTPVHYVEDIISNKSELITKRLIIDTWPSWHKIN